MVGIIPGNSLKTILQSDITYTASHKKEHNFNRIAAEGGISGVTSINSIVMRRKARAHDPFMSHSRSHGKNYEWLAKTGSYLGRYDMNVGRNRLFCAAVALVAFNIAQGCLIASPTFASICNTEHDT